MNKRRNHIIFWVFFFVWNGALIFIGTRNSLTLPLIVLRIFLGNIMSLFLFYFYSVFLIPNTLSFKKKISFILGIIFSMIFASLFHYSISELLNIIYPNIFPSNTLHNSFIRSLLSVIKAINLAFPYWLIKTHFEEINKKITIERTFYQLEKIILNSQLLALKNQINPHFFYNILNFLYSQALPFSSKLSNSILILSDMMRYAIRENDEGKVSLEQEVNYMKNYIQLENLHINESGTVTLETKGNFKYRRVFAMTFQPFLENCFKYGKDNKFYLEARENQIQFICTCSLKNETKKEDINKSFENLKTHFMNGYVNNLSIDINSDAHFYKIQLFLKI